MGWADNYIERLKNGETIQFRPRGNSMMPRIYSGDLVTVRPIVEGEYQPRKNAIVLCKVNGHQYLHLVGAKRGDRYRIENASGFVNGWVSRENIYGIVIGIET